ncbi:MAG: hypothetical protein ACFFGP_16240 [Promethearchaeota archaeon]
MNSSEIQLDLTITEADADPERLDELTGRLLRDLRDLGAESVERAPGEAAPEGAKGDPFTIGALVLGVMPVVLPKLIEFMQTWALRGENRTVKIKTAAGLDIEFTPDKKLSPADLEKYVKALSKAQA